MPYDTELIEAYATFIETFPWDYYSTVTFRRPRRDAIAAGQAVSRSLSTLGASRAFLAVEGHKSGLLHVHALSRHLFHPDLQASSAYTYLFKAHGRATVEPIRDAGKVTAYCAKYVVKGNDFDFWGDPENWLLDERFDTGKVS